jgi:hypothetical protein
MKTCVETGDRARKILDLDTGGTYTNESHSPVSVSSVQALSSLIE